MYLTYISKKIITVGTQVRILNYNISTQVAAGMIL